MQYSALAFEGGSLMVYIFKLIHSQGLSSQLNVLFAPEHSSDNQYTYENLGRVSESSN